MGASAIVTSSDDLTLLPWTTARAALADRQVRVRVLTPPYRAAGVGTLRCLRILPLHGAQDGAWELILGYERYDRL